MPGVQRAGAHGFWALQGGRSWSVRCPGMGGRRPGLGGQSPADSGRSRAGVFGRAGAQGWAGSARVCAGRCPRTLGGSGGRFGRAGARGWAGGARGWAGRCPRILGAPGWAFLAGQVPGDGRAAPGFERAGAHEFWALGEARARGCERVGPNPLRVMAFSRRGGRYRAKPRRLAAVELLSGGFPAKSGSIRL